MEKNQKCSSDICCLFKLFLGLKSRTRLSLSDGTSSNNAANRKDSGASSIAKKVSKTTSMDSPPSPSDLAGSMHSYLQEILNRHASHLLEDYSVRDLG